MDSWAPPKRAWLTPERPPEGGTKPPLDRVPVVPPRDRVIDEDEDGSLADEPLDLIDDDDDEDGMLDDATSERDPIGPDDIDEDLDRGEGVDWRDASEDAEGEHDEESSEKAEEYGWTSDAEAQGVDGGDDVLAETTDEPTASEATTDASEDGPDDDAGATIDDLLSERRTGALDPDDDVDELLDLDGEDKVGGALTYEQEARMTGASLPVLDAEVDVEWLGPDEGAIAVGVGAGAVWCLGDALYRLDGDRFVAVEVPGLASFAPNGLAVDPRADGLLAIGTALGGALVSEDAGRTWRRLGGVELERRSDDTSIEVAIESGSGRARLWGRTRAGRVLVCDELTAFRAASDVRADALVASSDGVVTALRATDGSLAIRWTRDGGVSWRSAEIRADLLSAAGQIALAISETRIAVGVEGAPDGLWTIDPRTSAVSAWPWPSPSALRFGPRASGFGPRASGFGPPSSGQGVAGNDELGTALGAAGVALGAATVASAGELWAGTFLSSVDRGVLARNPDGAPMVVLDVGAERVARKLPRPPEGDPEGRIAAIACDGGRVLVACSVGVLAVRVRPMGASRLRRPGAERS